MLKALKYWYEVKRNPIDKDRGLGIIPYVYKQAYDYYYGIWLAAEQNKTKNMSEYIPKDIVIHVKPPERDIKKRKLFSFLDEEDENNT